MDMLICFDGFPTVFETSDKKEGVDNLNVKITEIIYLF